MPTISQLPPAARVTSADEVPLSQDGTTHSIRVGTLLASMQPAITSEPGTLLGRTSLGAGGPEAVAVGPGLVLHAGTLIAQGTDLINLAQQAAITSSDQVVLKSDGNPVLVPLMALRSLFSAGNNININASGTISTQSGVSTAAEIESLPRVATIASNDLVPISQGGTAHAISYANFLDGLTIDSAQPAVAPSDSDTVWVAQGSSTMLRQSLSAVWLWLAGKLPSYKMPVVELTTNATLDSAIHNGRVLICSQPIILAAAPLNTGSGFHCDVINLSSGEITFGTGITTSSGLPRLPSGQFATLRGASYSGGNVVFASLSSAASSDGPGTQMPGQVLGLQTTDPTAGSITLNWSPPESGGPVSTYAIQYRIFGASAWSVFAADLTATAGTVTGLTSDTVYDFQVYATNGAGSGPPSSVLTAATELGAVIDVTWNMVPSGPYTHAQGSIGVNAHINPGTAAVQFGFSTSAILPPGSWTEAMYVNTDLWGAYVSTPGISGNWYAWVEGTDGSKPTVYPIAFTVT